MAVLPTQTVAQCKLCVSQYRPEIDLLLEQRSKRTVLPDGTRVNGPYVLKRLADEYNITNPTEDNIKNHWKRHCRAIDSDVVEQAQAAAVIRLQEMKEQGIEIDVNKDLDLMWALGMAELEERVARGERSGISPEMMMKIAAEKTRRQHNETQDKLLGALAGGITHALGGAMQRIALPKPTPVPVEMEDIVEGDYEEVEVSGAD